MQSSILDFVESFVGRAAVGQTQNKLLVGGVMLCIYVCSLDMGGCQKYVCMWGVTNHESAMRQTCAWKVSTSYKKGLLTGFVTRVVKSARAEQPTSRHVVRNGAH